MDILKKIGYFFKDEYYIGTYLKIPIYLHFSFVMFLFFLGGNVTHLCQIIGLFLIIILHEYGHILAANKYNILTHKIVLYPIGGAAMIENIGDKPSQELDIAISGPLINVFLFPIFYFWNENIPSELSNFLYSANLGVFFFNVLIPAFPMDGGRILRSLILMKTKNHYLSTKIAVRIGQIIFFIMFCAAIYYNHIILGLIAVLLSLASEAELLQSKLKHIDLEFEKKIESLGVIKESDLYKEYLEFKNKLKIN